MNGKRACCWSKSIDRIRLHAYFISLLFPSGGTKVQTIIQYSHVSLPNIFNQEANADRRNVGGKEGTFSFVVPFYPRAGDTCLPFLITSGEVR